MAISFPLTFSLAPMPTGEALDANAYGQQLVANLQASISGDFLTGQIGGTAPTTDVGPWFTNGAWWYWDPGTSAYTPVTVAGVFPVGVIVQYGGTVAPAGFLLCDGASYSQTSQITLFSVIGQIYGTGTGSGAFNVPDFRSRTSIGAGQGSGLTLRTIGSKVGGETSALSIANLAAHTHTITDPGHFHQTNFQSSGFASGVAGSALLGNGGNIGTISLTTATGITATNSNGSGTAFTNMQPSLAVSYIIKST